MSLEVGADAETAGHDAAHGSAEIMRLAVSRTMEGVVAFDHANIITFVNPAACRIFGYAAADILGRSITSVLPATTLATVRHRQSSPHAVEALGRRASGEAFPVELSLARVHGHGRAGGGAGGADGGGGGGGGVAIVRDIARRKLLEQDRADSRALLTMIIEHLPAMLFVKDSATQRYIVINKAGADIVGRPIEEIIGRTDGEIFADTGADRHASSVAEIRSRNGGYSENDFLCHDGRLIVLRTKGIELAPPDADGHYTLGLTEDVTDLRRSENRVHQLAYYDSLTGLLNRTSFADRLERLVGAETPFAVLALDLDRFKAVNDQFGHLAGDRLLIEVGQRLRRITTSQDVIARIGGDEFSIILVGADPASRAVQVGGAAILALSRPYPIEGVVAHVGAGVGVAVAPGDGNSVETLRQAADLALHRSKEIGRGTISFFSAELDRAAADRRALESDLRRALDSRAIGVAYQPVISVVTGQISSFEALARWTHHDRGAISPEVFIPIAEQCGLIGELGAQVLEMACQTAATWREDVRIAVNLSPMQFEDPAIVLKIRQTLSRSGLAPHRLQVEVTERLVIRDADKAFGILAELRALGVQILMDDFGVGYSSLSYFERFAFDKVKIDRSFVSKLFTSVASRAIVEAVIRLSKSLGMGIVAEGVETQDQQRLLVELGCTHLQGYLFGEPRPAEYFAPFVALRQVGPSRSS